MKKIFYILPALALFIGCQKFPQAQDEDPAYYPYIFFDAQVTSTKAELLNSLPSDPGTSIGVFGYRSDAVSPVFHMYQASLNNTEIDYVAPMYRQNEDGSFIYDEFAIWASGEHTFYAFYPYDENIVTEAGTSSDSKPYITYVQPDVASEIVDLMTATAAQTYNAASPTPVSLTFYHRLFAFDILVKNGQESGDIVVTDAEVTFTVPDGAKLYFDETLILSEGTVDITETLRVSDTGSESSDDVTASTDGTQINPSTFLFLPCGSIDVKLTLTASDSYSSSTALSFEGSVAPEGGFLSGKKYALVISKVDAERFEASVRDWETGAEVSFTFK